VTGERFSEIPYLKILTTSDNVHNAIYVRHIFLYFLSFSFFFSKETHSRVVDIVTGIEFGDLAFYPLWGAREFCLLQMTRWFFGFFSQPIHLVQVSILLALTVHFTPPCSKRKGRIHPAPVHESPEGNINIAVLFL